MNFSAIRFTLTVTIASAIAATLPRSASAETLPQPLVELMKHHADDPTSDSAAEIGRQLSQLRATGNAKLAKHTRAAWAQPNFYGEIGIETLAPRELDRLITDRSPVVDTILGTSIRGHAETTGKVVMQLVPNRNQGIFELIMRGTTTANTTGVNGPARIRSTSHSTFTAITRVRMTPEGLVNEPSRATASTHSQLHDLQVPRRRFPNLGDGRRHFAERIGRRKAARLKPQADAIAARHSEARYEKSMTEYVAASLEKTNEPFRERVREPLLQRGALYESVGFSTTLTALRARMLYADGIELGAATPAPTFAQRHSLAARIHESLLRNVGQMVFRGATLEDQTIAQFMRTALGEIPREAREFRLGSHLQPWSVTLAEDHPFVADFASERSTFGVRIQTVTIAGSSTPVDILFSADYRIEYTPQGPCFKRLGDVRIVSHSSADGQPPSEILNFVRLKASNFFISEIWFDGLVPPAGGPFDKYAQLNFAELIVEDGWLALGFDQPARAREDKIAATQKGPRSQR